MKKKYASSISIVIPAKNEGSGIERILKEAKKHSDDVIVVDGHSNDGTKGIAQRLHCRFYFDNGKGKGDAMKIGVSHARHKVIIFFDADGSHDPNGIPEMAKLLLTRKADLVIGSRRTGGSFDVEMSFTGILRSAGCDLLVMLVNKRFDTKLTDILYSFRGIHKPVFNALRLVETGFGIEQEMIIKSLRQGYTVAEMPSREFARGWGASKLRTIQGINFLTKVLREFF